MTLAGSLTGAEDPEVFECRGIADTTVALAALEGAPVPRTLTARSRTLYFLAGTR